MPSVQRERVPASATTTELSEAVSVLDGVWREEEDVRPAVASVLSAGADPRPFFASVLAKLGDPTFGSESLGGRTRRSVYVEAVLVGGYPWALELEPTDVAQVRQQVQRRSSRRSPNPVLVAALVLVAGVAATFWRANRTTPVASDVVAPNGLLAPRAVPTKVITPELDVPTAKRSVEETAEAMRERLETGDLAGAKLLGEACVLSFNSSQACMVMLAATEERLSRENNLPTPELTAARRWYALSSRTDVFRRTIDARSNCTSRLAADWQRLIVEVPDPHGLLHRLREAARASCIPTEPSCDSLVKYFFEARGSVP